MSGTSGIGLLGTGIMGAAMARRLAEAGYRVLPVDRLRADHESAIEGFRAVMDGFFGAEHIHRL